MKTRDLTVAALLLAVGTILHLMPGIFVSVKPDFMLVCMFTFILYNRTLSGAVAIGVAGGILAALTTNVPGGQLPNFIQAVLTCLIVYCMSKGLDEAGTGMKNNLLKGIIFFVGTLISGFIFLYIVLEFVGLPGNPGLSAMFMGIVLPTAFANIVIGFILDKLMAQYKKSVRI